MEILSTENYLILSQVKSAKPGQNKFKFVDLETNQEQNFMELNFPGSIESACILVYIVDYCGTVINQQRERATRNKKLSYGDWNHKLRFSVPGKEELGAKIEGLNSFRVLLDICEVKQDGSLASIQQVNFGTPFKIVTHYNQLPNKTIEKKIQKKPRKSSSKPTSTKKIPKAIDITQEMTSLPSPVQISSLENQPSFDINQIPQANNIQQMNTIQQMNDIQQINNIQQMNDIQQINNIQQMNDIQQINNIQQMNEQIEQFLQFPELSYFDDCTLYQFSSNENDSFSISLIPTAVAVQEEIQSNSVFDYIMNDYSIVQKI